MRWLTIIILSAIILPLNAQTDSLTLEEQLAALELELDSLSIFNLIDSLFNEPEKSEVNVRFGYSSSRLSAGRDFNLNQQGYAPGISYYHTSGFYGDWTTFFDNQSKGAINLSILHGGYMTAKGKWILNPYIEKTFNHQPSSYQLNQSLGMSTTFTTKPLDFNLDYAFLWGKEEVGHRIVQSISKTFTAKKLSILGKVNFYPSVSLMAGTTTVLNYLYSDDQVDNYLMEVQSLTDSEIRALRRSGQISTEQAVQLIITRNLLETGTAEDVELLKDWLNILEEDAAFALLNANISLPISFYIQKTSVMMSYSYSFPFQLPGEDIGVNPSGFFSLSLSRTLR